MAKPTFFCTIIPTGNVTADGYVPAAVLVTPVIRAEANDPPEMQLDKPPAPFAQWPELTGLPSAPRLGVTITLKAEISQPPNSPFQETQVEIAPFALKPPAGRDAQALAARFWKRLLGDARVVPVPVPAGGVEAGGATPVAQRYDAAPKNLAEAGEKIRLNRSTVEGIGTHDLMREVVMPLLETHFFQDDGRFFASQDQDKMKKLDRYSFALERLDRVGSAGASSAAVQGAREAGEVGGNGGDAKKGEFHELLSALGDDRTLLRWLGLVFDVRVKLPAGWDAAVAPWPFDLRLSVTIPGEGGGFTSDGETGRATPCAISPAASGGQRFGHVDCERDRDAINKPEGEDALAGAGFFLPSRLDTVQADPIAVLRAALRDREDREGRRKPGDGGNPERVRKPGERRAPLLLGHGITIFRVEGEKFIGSAKDSLNQGGKPEKKSAVWQPEDLARGYVVDVRAQPWWPEANPADQVPWTEWKRLCRRKVVYNLLTDNGKTGDRLPEVTDEACLSVAASEGATPLAGFLLGPVEALKPEWISKLESKEENAEARREIAAFDGRRRPLSAKDCDALGYPREFAGRRINYFLLATPGGTIVVADVPPPEDLRAGRNRGPITRRLAELEPARFHLGGSWVELAGTSAQEGGYFLAVEAKFEDEFIGVAGVVRRGVQERMLGGGSEKMGRKMACVAIDRWQLTLLAGIPKKEKPDEMEELNLVTRSIEDASALLFFHFSTESDRNELLNWVAAKVTAETAVFAQMRGEPVLAVRRLEDIGLEALRTRLELVFVRVVEGRRLEFRPSLPEADAERALPVKLELADDAEVRTLTGLNPPLEELPEGSVFRVQLQKVEIGKLDFKILSMGEISRERPATLIESRREGSAVFVRLRIAGVETNYSVGAETIVEIDDLAMPEKEKEEAQPGEPHGEAKPKVQPADVVVRYLRGPWPEHGHRLQRNDECAVQLISDGDGKPLRISKLRVVARDRTAYRFGWFTLDLTEAEKEIVGDREELLAFLPLRPDASRELIQIDDQTVIAAGPPFPGALWRRRQMPPAADRESKEPYRTTMVRVLAGSTGGGITHAKQVDVLNALRGMDLQFTEAADQPDRVALTMKLRGFEKPFTFLAPPKLPGTLTWPGLIQWLGERPAEKTPDAGDIELLANETLWVGELRFRSRGTWIKRADKKLIFGRLGKTPDLELENLESDFRPHDSSAGFTFELRFNFAKPDKVEVRARIVEVPQTLVIAQLKPDDGLRPEEFTADARILINPADNFANAEGSDRALLFLRDLWKTNPFPAVAPPEPAYFEQFLQLLAETGLPIELRAIPAVQVDHRVAQNPAAAARRLKQWWNFYQAAPPLAKADPAKSGDARPVFPEKAFDFLLSGRPEIVTAYGENGEDTARKLWTVALRPATAAANSSEYEPPDVFKGVWGKVDLPEAKIQPASRSQDAGEELLPDQVILEDALVHWFGNSLALNEKRRATFDRAGTEEPPRETELSTRIDIAASVPEGELIPLRIGWKYQFRFRAVWVTADAVDFDAPFLESLALDFRPFGRLGKPYERLDRFMRVEPFHPPQLGWKHEGEVRDGAPDGQGWVKAPDVSCDEQAKQRDHLQEWNLLPPRVARQLKVKSEKPWGSPSDLILHSDMAESGADAKETGECCAETTGTATAGGKPPPPKFEILKPLDQLPGEPLIVLRPAELSQREIERLGALEQWEAEHPGHTLYWDVLWAHDEVEPNGAWWRALPEFEERLRGLRLYQHGGPLSYEDEAAFWKPTVPATPGRLLHRLPDPHAQRLSLTITVENTPGVWKELTDGTFILGENARFDFMNVKDGCHWPKCREFHLTVGRKSPTGAYFSEVKEERILTVYPPRDADWRLEIRTLPREKALDVHAFQVWKDSDSAAKWWGKVKAGQHPLIEPAAFVRIRHVTNQPARAPRKIALRLVPRVAGDTHADFQGRYEIDRPSTGALLIQAALEKDCVDDPAAPIPRVPAAELARILAVPKDTSDDKIPVVSDSDAAILGRASDSTRTLRVDEFAVSDLEPMTKTVSPFGPPEEAVGFLHQIGDTRHRRVYYRALAISRWESFFAPEFRKPKQINGTAPPPLVYTNPLRGPFTRQEAIALECTARAKGEAEPWRWHRVEIPATKRPETPVLPDAERLRTAFGWNPQWTDENQWTGGGTRWHFSRTRLPGCRVWLARPWYSSGADEKLAVLCIHRTRVRRAEKERVLRIVSRWAMDAAGTPPADELQVPKAGLLTRDAFISAEAGSPIEIEVPPASSGGAMSVRPDPTALPTVGAASGGPIRVGLAVHTPRFHTSERQWFCDLFIRPRVYRPFLWLSLARYQPYAIPGAALSEPIKPHPVQVLPQRSLEISLTAEAGVLRVEIEVAGLISPAFRREVICRLQRRVPGTAWRTDDVPARFDARDPRPLDPAAESPSAVDMDRDGEFWQTLSFRGVEAEAGFVQILTPASPGSGIYRGEILIEAHHVHDSKTGLRLSIEEREYIPPAWQRETEPCPLYFDQVKLPPKAIELLARSQPVLQR